MKKKKETNLEIFGGLGTLTGPHLFSPGNLAL